jgi:hypothetical protein
MRLIYGDSLGKTVDAVNEALFFNRGIDEETANAVGDWIAARAWMPGAYLPGMIAPTEVDLKQGFQLFTGERITTHAGVRHILGEEACRVLAKLDLLDDCVDRAIEGTAVAMEKELSLPQNEGRFCCRTCSVAMWRNLAAGGLKGSKNRLRSGLNWLSQSRSDDGRWGNFPFHYTVLTLLEIEMPEAFVELAYARPAIERALHAGSRGDAAISERRKAIMERALERVGSQQPA